MVYLAIINKLFSLQIYVTSCHLSLCHMSHAHWTLLPQGVRLPHVVSFFVIKLSSKRVGLFFENNRYFDVPMLYRAITDRCREPCNSSVSGASTS